MSHAGIGISRDFVAMRQALAEYPNVKKFPNASNLFAFAEGKPGVVGVYAAYTPIDVSSHQAREVLIGALKDGREIIHKMSTSWMEIEFAVLFDTVEDFTAFQLKYL